MTSWTWLAFGCYLLGACLGIPGLVFAYREARDVGRAVRAHQAAPRRPGVGESFASSAKARDLAVVLAGDGKTRRRAVWLIGAGLLVELIGNLLSLPW